MNERLANLENKLRLSEKGLYLRDGNFSVCILPINGKRLPDEEDVVIGVAKRNPNCDTYDEGLGFNIAYLRAVKKLMPKSRIKKAKKATK